MKMLYGNVLAIGILLAAWTTKADLFSSGRSCAARWYPDAESVVCVCNATYCDDFVRREPAPGCYVAYTSSKAGFRFFQTMGKYTKRNQKHQRGKGKCEDKNALYITVDTSTQFQRIEGFGGATTDSAGINWKSVSRPVQKYLVDSYYSNTGLEYNMIRVPIGGCDFSPRGYAYNDLPVDDVNLTNYTLTIEDVNYKIPMIQSCMKVATDEVHVVATTWSPPVWMKTSDSYVGVGSLKPEYFQTYADYHIKFLELYTDQGIPIWGITTTNEPANGYTLPPFPINSLGWTASDLGQWVTENLGPTLRNSEFSDTLILTFEDQRFSIPRLFNSMVMSRPEVLDWFDGIAIHYYGDTITPPCLLGQVAEDHPDKFILMTEACAGATAPSDEKVILGSWERAETYINSIIESLTYSVVGWIDWNLCLDPEGGPMWVENRVDSPIIVFSDADEFVKQPMFYAMGHFSKFVPRGSRRVQLTQDSCPTLQSIGFVTTRKTLVVVVFNSGTAKRVCINVGNNQVCINSPERSVTTVEIK